MRSKLLTLILLLSATIWMLGACSKGTEPTQVSVPVLTTTAISGIVSTSAASGGTITSDGGSAVTVRGICWNTTATPTITDSKTTDGTGMGSFTSTITGLTLNTRYYVRAYATNSRGTGYGNTVTFVAGTIDDPLAYFGQTPPGRALVSFAQNIIGNFNHGVITFSPDGYEAYWTSTRSILFSKLINGTWTTPAVISFSGQGSPQGSIPYDDNPVVSPDNSKLFFTSLRPIGYASPNRENIWYVDRTSTGWSEPKPLPQVVNSVEGIHWQVSVANNGNLYFAAINDSMRLYVSRYVNGEYVTPEAIRKLNNFGNLDCPFIAPDESYIMFNKIVDSRPSLYISFKDRNGQWLTPQIMSQMNSGPMFVSRDGKYIFAMFEWISAQIIEDYRLRE